MKILLKFIIISFYSLFFCKICFSQGIDITVFLKENVEIVEDYKLYAVNNNDSTLINPEIVNLKELYGKDLYIKYNSIGCYLYKPFWDYQISIGLDKRAFQKDVKILLYDNNGNKSTYLQNNAPDNNHYVRYMPKKHNFLHGNIDTLVFYKNFIKDRKFYKDSVYHFILTYLYCNENKVIIEKYNSNNNSFFRYKIFTNISGQVTKVEMYNNSFYPLSILKNNYKNNVPYKQEYRELNELKDSTIFEYKNNKKIITKYDIDNNKIIKYYQKDSINEFGKVIKSITKNENNDIIKLSKLKYDKNLKLKYISNKEGGTLNEEKYYYNSDKTISCIENIQNGKIFQKSIYDNKQEKEILFYNHKEELSHKEVITYSDCNLDFNIKNYSQIISFFK